MLNSGDAHLQTIFSLIVIVAPQKWHSE